MSVKAAGAGAERVAGGGFYLGAPSALGNEQTQIPGRLLTHDMQGGRLATTS